MFFDPAAGMDDFGDRFGGFFCPHFDQEGTTIIQALQGGKDSGEINTAFTYIANALNPSYKSSLNAA